MFAFALTSSQARTPGCPKPSSQPAGSQLLALAAAAGKYVCAWSLPLHGGLLTTGAGLLAGTTPAF